MEKLTLFKELEEIAEHDDAALDILKPRLVIAAGVIVFFAIVVVCRLWFLQISNGDEYKDKAYNNRVRERRLEAPRGHILDRNGLELVTNRPSFNVLLIRENSTDHDELLKKLAVILNEDISDLWSRIREASNIPLHVPIVLKEDIDWNTLAYLENHNHEFSGVRIEVSPRRVYKFGDLAAHIIGYLGVISKEELSNAAEDTYTGEDHIGKMGLERLREKDLRGETGTSYLEVNARGFEQQMLKHIDPLPGNELHLTLDVHMQQIAESMMAAEDMSGSVVAMEVNSGRVLTLASSPTIHLEHFIGGISTKNWQALLDDIKKPLLNKPVQGTYPPGSVYKMVTALAGLGSGVIDANTVFYCPGHYSFGNRVYRCWKKSGHGTVDLRRAIAESCDVYFYQVGSQVGVDGLADYAHKLGLGEISGLEIENEKSGLIPTKKWKQQRYNTKWQDGETLSIAIGQGFNLVTPLQVNVMTSILANGGKKYRPKLVEKVIDPDGKVLETFQPEIVTELTGMEQHFEKIQQGMFDVIQGSRGTARGARIKGLEIAGKTGTAQVVKVAVYKHLKEEDIPYQYRDHAWFTCYAPFDNPEVAVTVMVEHGLHGGSEAAPIAKAVLEAYFGDRLLEMQEAAEEP